MTPRDLSFVPIVPTWVLAAVGGVLGLGVLVALVTLVTGGRHRVWPSARLLLATLLAVGIGLGPSTGHARVRAVLTNLDVVFVVDTTPSAAAQDYHGRHTRLSGMRADVAAIARGLPGAQYELVTFDSDTEVVLPLTSDASALTAALAVIHPQTVDISTGSSIDQPVPTLRRLLSAYQRTRPGRRVVLVYCSDGEQTVRRSPGSFASLAPLVAGGAVLGYGTPAGGRMLAWEDYGSGSRPMFIADDTGEPARSRIDQVALRKVAGQLGVPYAHRLSAAGARSVVRVPPTRPAPGTGRTVGIVAPLYWPLGALLGLVVLWELAAAVVDRPGRVVRG